MMDVFSVEIVSAVWCTSVFLRRDRFFEPYRGEARVQRRDRLGGVVHEYVLAA
jgi:hypothetical protein